MTERDPFEDILSQFRPVGPRPEMQPPTALMSDTSPSDLPHPSRMWIAGGLLVATGVTVGTVWLWESRRSAPQANSTTPAVLAAQPRRLTVGGGIKAPTRLIYVAPAYPDEAQDQKVGGTVILRALIATDGSVLDVEVIRSVHVLLDEAAAKAVGQWKFVPTEVDGEPVELLMTCAVTFTVQE